MGYCKRSSGHDGMRTCSAEIAQGLLRFASASNGKSELIYNMEMAKGGMGTGQQVDWLPPDNFRHPKHKVVE